VVGQQAGVVGVEVGVAVQHDRGRGEEPLGEPEGAGRAERFRLGRVFDRDAEGRPVPEPVADLPGAVAEAEHEAPGAPPPEQLDLDLEERGVADRGEALRAVGHGRPEARPQPAGQDQDRNVRKAGSRHAASARLRPKDERPSTPQ
jgi:hypothetical protein